MANVYPDDNVYGAPPQKKSTTPIIIAVVVALMLCCCCMALLLSALWVYGDQLIETMGAVPQLLPLLALG
jgi:hypothetical protein